jgi:hypothetical protein
VYWTDTNDQKVRSVPRHGGSITVLAQNQAKPYGVATDGTYVYWANNLGGAVMRTLANGLGTPSVVASAVSPLDVAVDGTNVYWLQLWEVDAAPKGGGTAHRLANTPTAAATAMVFDGNNELCWVSASSLSCIDTNGNLKWSLVGEEGPSLAVDSARVSSWVPSGTSLNWFDKMNGASLGEFQPVIGVVTGIAANSCGVYWNELKPNASSAMFAAPRSGDFSGREAIATVLPQASPTRIVLDRGWIFWVDKTAIGAVPIP